MELEFDSIERTEHLAMHLLDHSGIAKETVGIELLHLAGEFLDSLCCLRIVMDHLAEMVEFAHSLLERALGVSGIA